MLIFSRGTIANKKQNHVSSHAHMEPSIGFPFTRCWGVYSKAALHEVWQVQLVGFPILCGVLGQGVRDKGQDRDWEDDVHWGGQLTKGSTDVAIVFLVFTKGPIWKPIKF